MLIIFTAYSHQLKEPHKSFDVNLTLKDFKDYVKRDMTEAKTVVYINPRNQSYVIKE